ncbi:MAG TPA: hypothetical protein VIY86_03205 [Pirellulaceae bacterium]
MLTHRLGFPTRHVISLGIGLSLALLGSGCRSTSQLSKVPGMGWMANRDVPPATASAPADPAAELPAPSSAEAAQWATNIPSPPAANLASTASTTQSANLDPSTASGAAIPASYPTTGYPQVRTAGGATPGALTSPGTYPGPTAVATTGTPASPWPPASSAANSGPDSADTVQQGFYSTPAPRPPDPALAAAPPMTTWDLPPLDNTTIDGATSGSTYELAATNPPTVLQASQTPPAGDAFPPSPAGGSGVYGPGSTGEAGVNLPAAYEAPLHPVDSGIAQTSGVSAPGGGSQVSPSDYQSGIPSHYQSAPATSNGSSSNGSMGQPWRPGSTAGYPDLK